MKTGTNPHHPAFHPVNLPTSLEQAQAAGLTKREYFAALAMQGIMSDYENIKSASPEDVAKDAVNTADALIESLNKESGK